MKDYKNITISEHFIDRCKSRAPWFLRARKKKFGGGFELNLPDLCHALKTAEEIERPKSISRLIRYGDKTRYFHFSKAKLKRQVIFVVENNILITVYEYNHSWAVIK